MIADRTCKAVFFRPHLRTGCLRLIVTYSAGRVPRKEKMTRNRGREEDQDIRWLPVQRCGRRHSCRYGITSRFIQ
ncbi:hypothetical protein LMG28138_00002 [Pararobbsia alpina]|uniref:Uncharacterized protein n=1 Tax=Pararobbsia alpina TaxID=621374 RepID=A0A6S7ARQ4_9BURK|nr:hypothetical protein LMG28138_00002 [Pararobbsia alpina]